MGDSTEPDPDDLGDEIDEVVKVLAVKQRRYVLHDLETHNSPVAVADLADRLAQWSGTGTPKAMRLSLLHRHLPTMADAGLVNYDCDTCSVSITRKGEIANEGRKAYVEVIAAKCKAY